MLPPILSIPHNFTFFFNRDAAPINFHDIFHQGEEKTTVFFFVEKGNERKTLGLLGELKVKIIYFKKKTFISKYS